ncbi:uncharacterized protein KY384_002397 [Bacidia gigantensis]|uniref:uncharacterized protein n=1 Tax=Bacidia gigantensis TaxID=2732470 RepID=UPI001D04BE1F|nr:uncharacterized protein KY384_002397 [Bacidia gigantensis]KAG8532520.1 hypothetical protein KY384_002397 [Bacidia gigantensis]
MNVPQEICNLVSAASSQYLIRFMLTPQITYYVDDGLVPEDSLGPHTWLQMEHNSDESLRSLELTSKAFYRAICPCFQRKISVTSRGSLGLLNKASQSPTIANYVEILDIRVYDDLFSDQNTDFAMYINDLSNLVGFIGRFQNLRALALSYRRLCKDHGRDFMVGKVLARIIGVALRDWPNLKLNELVLDMPVNTNFWILFDDFLPSKADIKIDTQSSHTDCLSIIQHLRVQVREDGLILVEEEMPLDSNPVLSHAEYCLSMLINQLSNLDSLCINCDSILSIYIPDGERMQNLQVLDLTRVRLSTRSLRHFTIFKDDQRLRSVSLEEVQLDVSRSRRSTAGWSFVFQSLVSSPHLGHLVVESCGTYTQESGVSIGFISSSDASPYRKGDGFKELDLLLRHVARVRRKAKESEQQKRREMEAFPTSLTSPSDTIPGNWFAKQSEEML